MEKLKVAIMEWAYVEGYQHPVKWMINNDSYEKHANMVLEIISVDVSDYVEFIFVPPNEYGIAYLREHPEIKIVSASQGGGAISNNIDDWTVPQLCFVATGNDGTGDVGTQQDGNGESDFAMHPSWHAVGAINTKSKFASYSSWESSWGRGAVEFVGITGLLTSLGVFWGTSCSCPYLVNQVIKMYLAFYDKVGRYPYNEEALVVMRENVQDVLEDGNDLKTGLGLYELNHDMPDVMSMVENENKIKVNKEVFEFDGKAQIMDGRMYIPVRPMEKMKDTSVAWDNSTRTASIMVK